MKRELSQHDTYPKEFIRNNMPKAMAAIGLCFSLALTACDNSQSALIPTEEPSLRPAPTDIAPFQDTSGLEIGLQTKDLCALIPGASGPTQLYARLFEIPPTGDEIQKDARQIDAKVDDAITTDIGSTPDAKTVNFNCQDRENKDITFNPSATCDNTDSFGKTYEISIALLAKDMAFAVNTVDHTINGRPAFPNGTMTDGTKHNQSFVQLRPIEGAANKTVLLVRGRIEVHAVFRNQKVPSLVQSYRCQK